MQSDDIEPLTGHGDWGMVHEQEGRLGCMARQLRRTPRQLCIGQTAGLKSRLVSVQSDELPVTKVFLEAQPRPVGAAALAGEVTLHGLSVVMVAWDHHGSCGPRSKGVDQPRVGGSRFVVRDISRDDQSLRTGPAPLNLCEGTLELTPGGHTMQGAGAGLEQVKVGQLNDDRHSSA